MLFVFILAVWQAVVMGELLRLAAWRPPEVAGEAGMERENTLKDSWIPGCRLHASFNVDILWCYQACKFAVDGNKTCEGSPRPGTAVMGMA